MPDTSPPENADTPATTAAPQQDTSPSSPSMLFFVILTTLYAVLTYFAESQTLRMMWLAIYFLLLIVIQFYLNLGVTAGICGSPQYGTTAIVTFIPWTLIFGMLKVILTVFPGWLSPFANTIGYLIARLAGIRETLDGVLAPKGKKASSSGALQHIYEDPSLLINEVTPQGFDSWWSFMKTNGLLASTADQFKDRMKQLVRLKEVVAEYIWFLLTGALVTSISFNYTVNSSCNLSADDIQERSAELTAQSARAAQAASTNNQRVYTTTE